MGVVNILVRFLSLLVERVYFLEQDSRPVITQAWSHTDLTEQHFPMLLQIIPWKLFLGLIRAADGRITASSFPLTIRRNTQEIRKMGILTLNLIFHENVIKGLQQPRLSTTSDCPHARFGICCGQYEGHFVSGIIEFYWPIKNSDKAAREMGKQCIDDVLSPGQSRNEVVERIQINLSSS